MATIPAFSLSGSDGRTWTGTELAGKPYVLYFYPKDDTPGCTAEGCAFRDAASDLAQAGLTVLGVSPDSVASHRRFIAKHRLNFTLLADPEHVLAEKLGVWAEKKNYGKTSMGVVRSTFLVGPDGAIVQEWRQVKVEGHVAAVLAAARALAT